jgi:carbon-monoxide dehydrogenase small subunit
MLMMVKSLLDENLNPTEEEIRFALSGNLCRCTGYAKIVLAVKDAAKELREGSKG